MAPDATQLSATSRLFSSAVLQELARKGRSALFARLVRLADLDGGGTVGDAFDRAFASLRHGRSRDEYVYRAALTHKVLLGTHSLRTACMLNEFRTGDRRADLVILNGTATVYEIKSERDSLVRLADQVTSYRRVFAKAYVIAGEAHVGAVLGTVPRDVGVMQLSRRHHISIIRQAEDRPDRICPATVFESLRTAEARSILSELGQPIPDVPNTRLYAAMREKFRTLAPADVHRAMIRVLRQTRDLAPLSDLVDKLPLSLQPAALSVPIRRGDHQRLVRATETPLEAAMGWA